MSRLGTALQPYEGTLLSLRFLALFMMVLRWGLKFKFKDYGECSWFLGFLFGSAQASRLWDKEAVPGACRLCLGEV